MPANSWRISSPRTKVMNATVRSGGVRPVDDFLGRGHDAPLFFYGVCAAAHLLFAKFERINPPNLAARQPANISFNFNLAPITLARFQCADYARLYQRDNSAGCIRYGTQCSRMGRAAHDHRACAAQKRRFHPTLFAMMVAHATPIVIFGDDFQRQIAPLILPQQRKIRPGPRRTLAASDLIETSAAAAGHWHLWAFRWRPEVR